MGWGYNTRLDNIQAAVLNVKFKYYPTLLKRRQEIANMYNQGLKGLVTLPTEQPGQIIQEYIIQLKNIWKFKKFMEKKQIELLIRDTTPNHKLPGLELAHFKLPITERMATSVVRLPCYPELTNEECKYIISCIRKFCGT